ncbi:hypothetical protein LIER_32758 [Lithospermum erythrorhizon]|uniref:Uncharacterized protein n=1 Tax=Lithospermum erythrorhizon TaxID=34254 RepID=A0AAV3RX92_LITER
MREKIGACRELGRGLSRMWLGQEEGLCGGMLGPKFEREVEMGRMLEPRTERGFGKVRSCAQLVRGRVRGLERKELGLRPRYVQR